MTSPAGTHRALVLRRDDPDAAPTVSIEPLDDGGRIPGATTSDADDGGDPAGAWLDIDVARSSLNYKDALVLAGHPGLVRASPHVPGIDLAGTVAASDDPDLPVGTEVLATGWWIGERHAGGMSTRARVRAGWTVVRPDGMDAQRAMALGTAGFTAQLAVDALTDGGVTPEDGPVLVTGATGGVGTVAVMLLARAGFEVEASTGRAGDPEVEALLAALGAARTIGRADVSDAARRPLASARWAGVVDVAGGTTLAGALAATRARGVVAVCGLVDDAALTTTVMPLIVRGVRIVGIDSVLHPAHARPAVWARLHDGVDAGLLASITTTVALDDVSARARDLLAGATRGRTVVDPHAERPAGHGGTEDA